VAAAVAAVVVVESLLRKLLAWTSRWESEEWLLPAPPGLADDSNAGLPGAAVPGPGEESPPVNALEGPRVAVLWCSSSMALCAWVWALDRRLARAPLPCARSRSTAMGESAGVGLVRATSCRRGGNSEERALDRHAAGALDGLECRLD
jgi:hypothetical protein